MGLKPDCCCLRWCWKARALGLGFLVFTVGFVVATGTALAAILGGGVVGRTPLTPGVRVSQGVQGRSQSVYVQAPVDVEAPAYVKVRAYVSSVACPSRSQCTAVDDYGEEVTFNPIKPGKPQPVALNHNLFNLASVACPSRSQCTAVGVLGSPLGPSDGKAGGEVTFNPTNPGRPSVVAIGIKGLDAGSAFVACPSRSQCTALDGQQGGEVTFNPAHPGTPKLVKIDDVDFDGLACPSTSQCTATDAAGRELTFNPSKHGRPRGVKINNGTVSNLACPSTSQCTVVGTGTEMGETTFNPTNPGMPRVVETEGPGETGLDAIACPSAFQCTAVGSGEATFNPTNPGTPKRIMIDHTGPIAFHSPGSALTGIACPSKSRCTAVDLVGNEITFNPTKPGKPKVVAIDR